MAEVKNYRIVIYFFALTAILCMAALPFAISCCSHFSAQELAFRNAGNSPWPPEDTPLANALLDWPRGFRLLLLTLIVAVLCWFATLASAFLARRSNRLAVWSISVRVLLACITVGILDILAFWVAAFLHYRGPANFIWMLGLPMLIAWMNVPRWYGLLLGMPLAIGGWIAMGTICFATGIPID